MKVKTERLRKKGSELLWISNNNNDDMFEVGGCTKITTACSKKA